MQFKFNLVSILDNDFYKFTMQNAVMSLYPHVKVRYKFINRGQHKFPVGFAEELRAHINAMESLRLTKAEQRFLADKCPYLSPAYLDYLYGYRFDPNEVQITQEGEEVEVFVEGYWYRSILWEMPILSLISELYYKMKGLTRISDEAVITSTNEKMERFANLGVNVAEFGTRRRYSYKVHELVVNAMMKYVDSGFVGTSNVHLAMKYSTRPIGTHAHEWFMFHAARFGFKMANSIALNRWVDVYHGDLGIALTDTYTSDVFFRSFNKKLAKLFDGVRHDSGDPIEFANKTIDHYKKFGINPLHKTITFSDSLNPDKVELISNACKERIGISFGIGTNLTNDVGVPPMNIVMKMMGVSSVDMDWISTVKLSDDHGKYTGDENMIHLAKATLGIDH